VDRLSRQLRPTDLREAEAGGHSSLPECLRVDVDAGQAAACSAVPHCEKHFTPVPRL